MDFSLIINDNVISWLSLYGWKVIKVVVLALALEFFADVLIKRIMFGASNHRFKLAEKQRVETLVSSFSNFLRVAIRIIALLTILAELDVNIAPILTAAGVFGLSISMAGKDFVADFMGGLFILTDDQFRIGDEVKIDQIEGVVQDITLRRTIIKGKDGREYFIPNSLVKISSRKFDKVKGD